MPNLYELLDINTIQLDVSNPRIAEVLSIHKEINAAAIALALGSGTDTGESSSTTFSGLKESIKANGGIINPIIVKKDTATQYTVVEGNTRLQIYKDFRDSGASGNWELIPAIVYSSISDEGVDAIRLQAHLVGPRPWDAYSKARYLNELYNVKHMPLDQLVPFCGGKASEVSRFIAAYEDMEMYFRPCLEKRGIAFLSKVRKFSAFAELQKKQISEAIVQSGYTKEDFAEWVADEKIDPLQHVRKLPKILANRKAHDAFMRKGSCAAVKILDALEITGYDELEKAPYDALARVLTAKLDNLAHTEVLRMRNSPEAADNRVVLLELRESLEVIISSINESDNE